MNLFLEFLVVLLEFSKALLWSIYTTLVSPPEKNVQGEIVLITGAGSGLGRLLCQQFAKRGATVVACDINTKGNEETADLVKQEGGAIYTYICDVSKRENIYELGEKVKRDIGDVTIVVNNAGIVTGKLFLDCPDSMIQKTMEINLMAHFWTTKHFLPRMLEKKHGHIVNIASIAGVMATTRMTDYCASKFGDVGFTESLDFELSAMGNTGVNTTCVCPYFINTGMFDGCNTRFPSILPVLDPAETVNTIMHAVLTNQKLIYIPRILYLLAFIKSLVPIEAGLVLHRFFGATTFMDTYVGRQQQLKADKPEKKVD